MDVPVEITRVRAIVARSDKDRGQGIPHPERLIGTDTVRVLLYEYDKLVMERDALKAEAEDRSPAVFGPKLAAR